MRERGENMRNATERRIALLYLCPLVISLVASTCGLTRAVLLKLSDPTNA